MCGITGFTWKDPSLIKKMTEKIEHRGPDDSGFFVEKGISLGHRRLSIIDLSKKGHQPMFNETKSIVIVFNGEIWNYLELKSDLQSKGHIFKSSSDTEVIIHGYEEYGESICEKLDGMFAFALWDIKKKSLFLARDKIGKKPLYYCLHENALIFSSEIKAFSVHVFPLEINQESMAQYLTLRFSPDSQTIVKGVKKLLPGTHALFKKGELTTKEYYSLPSFNQRNSSNVKKTDELIEKAVKKRLISDVPIGVFLSGGLDSSALVAYMSRFTNKIKTFSVTFDSKVDESDYARLVAKKFNTEHHEIRVERDTLKYLPEVVYFLDEPLADPAALPTYLLCKEVSKKVKVVLSGEGGDEVFGGYDSYNYISELRNIYNQPLLMRKGLVCFLSALSSLRRYPAKSKYKAMSEICNKKSIEEAFKELFYFPFSSQEKRTLGLPLYGKDAFDSILKKSRNLEEAAQNYYFKEWLPNDLLMKVDKMSMAHGLEVRAPFLDKDLFAYFSGISYTDKHKKSLFKKTISPLLPSEIINRKKQGFTVPLFEWFSDHKTMKRITPFLKRLADRNIFKKEVLEEISKNKGFKSEHKIWVLLNLELWFEIFVDKIPYQRIQI